MTNDIQIPTKVGEKSTSKQNDAWFQTTDTQLAAFLFTCGCKFAEPRIVRSEKASDPSYSVARWRFECGSELNTYGYSTDDTISIWKEAYSFISENQDSPISLILAGFKNFEKFKEILSDDSVQNTLIDYKVNNQTLTLIKGTNREKKLREKLGYDQR